MTTTVLARLGNGLRAANQIRVDRALLALGASALGASTALLSTLLPIQSGTIAWFIDLGAHWQWLYAFIGSIAGVRGSRWPVALATVVIGAGWLSSSEPARLSSAAPPEDFTIVSANLRVGEADLETLLHWVRSQNADVVVLQEVNEASAQALALWEDFPHQLVTPEEGPFGLAVVSRHALSDSQAIASVEQPLRYRTFVSWQGQRVGISAIHPMPPISALYHEQRARMFEDEVRWVNSVEVPTIVAGDFNASPWSSAMRRIDPESLRRATGLAPTWPAVFPVIPIDHVMISQKWHVTESGVGPNVGSDHRPVFAVLALP